MNYTVDLSPHELALLISCLDDSQGYLTKVAAKHAEAEPMRDNVIVLKKKLQEVGRTGNPEIPY